MERTKSVACSGLPFDLIAASLKVTVRTVLVESISTLSIVGAVCGFRLTVLFDWVVDAG